MIALVEYEKPRGQTAQPEIRQRLERISIGSWMFEMRLSLSDIDISDLSRS